MATYIFVSIAGGILFGIVEMLALGIFYGITLRP
jgi:hypothetical protein